MDIRTTYLSGRLTLYLTGELDHHEARCAIRTIDELMDSSGIAVIIKLNQRMKSLGGRMWVENPAKQPLRVIDASGIDRLVPVAISK